MLSVLGDMNPLEEATRAARIAKEREKYIVPVANYCVRFDYLSQMSSEGTRSQKDVSTLAFSRARFLFDTHLIPSMPSCIVRRSR